MREVKAKEVVKVAVKYACGCTQDVHLTGTRRVKIGKRARNEKSKICRACYAKALDLGLPPTVQTVADLSAAAIASEVQA